MKHVLLPVLTLFTTVVMAQGDPVYLTSQEYHTLKQTNQLDPAAQYLFTDLQDVSGIHYSKTPKRNDVCDCLVTLDNTFLLAMQPNDDGFSNQIPLPFTFDFYGTQYNSLFINNNGNISFTSPYSEFTASAFPVSGFNMIAPFWGDVDTRSTMGPDAGNVWYKLTPNALIVVWDSVGYYAFHEDKVSTFQLIITNGADPIIPGGNNVSFCYGDMQWTTGDASQGNMGFYGVPATVGVNIGNGTDYFQVGRFNQPGTGFDGPYGADDQISFLDFQEVYFNIAGATTTNTPPILVSSVICDTIDVYTGDTLQKNDVGVLEFTFSVSTPEIGQALTNQISSSEPDAFSYEVMQTSTEFYRYDCTFEANGLAPGLYTVTLTSTDNGVPAATTTSSVYINVVYDVSLDESLGLNNSDKETGFIVVPNPTNGKISVKTSGAPDNAEVIVTDLTGKPCITGTLNQLTTIDLGNLNNGVYFVVLASEGKVIGTQRVIKD